MIFLFGTLRYQPLLDLVAGGPVTMVPAQLPGWQVNGVAGKVYPVLTQAEGAVADGAAVSLSGEVLDRLVHYEDAFGYVLRDVTLLVDGQEVEGQVFVPEGPSPDPHGDWSLDTWIDKASERSLIGAEAVITPSAWS